MGREEKESRILARFSSLAMSIALVVGLILTGFWEVLGVAFILVTGVLVITFARLCDGVSNPRLTTALGISGSILAIGLSMLSVLSFGVWKQPILGAFALTAALHWCLGIVQVGAHVYRAPSTNRIRCRGCGYDLRGAFDYACPECGRAIPKEVLESFELPDPSSASKT